ncbi:MAG: response regulator [Bacillus subtilis]|nr:response regulator [Bacillus subtilis]
MIVDDEHFFLEIVVLYFARQSFLEVFTADTGAAAISFLKSHGVDLIVTDLRMPDMHGIELVSYLRRPFRTSPSSSPPPISTLRLLTVFNPSA